MITKELKETIIKEHARSEGDTGSSEVQVALLTERINQLDGERITIRGFIRPGVKQRGITRFIFVRDNQECCFGPGAALCDCVLVALRPKNPTHFTVRPITVTGTFVVKEYKVRDQVLAIFRMKDAVVE